MAEQRSAYFRVSSWFAPQLVHHRGEMQRNRLARGREILAHVDRGCALARGRIGIAQKPQHDGAKGLADDAGILAKFDGMTRVALAVVQGGCLFNVAERRGRNPTAESRHGQRLMRLKRKIGIVRNPREAVQLVGQSLSRGNSERTL